VRGGGMNALRGHSNIQGLTDLGLMSNLIPGYLTLPTDQEPDFASYIGKRGFKPERPGQMSYWQNYKKFFVSFKIDKDILHILAGDNGKGFEESIIEFGNGLKNIPKRIIELKGTIIRKSKTHEGTWYEIALHLAETI